jgi:hypothetical protein
MNRCRDFEQDLSALIDGELPGDRQAAVIAHVDACAACARRVAELQRLATGVAMLPKLPAPPGFLVEVRQRLAAPRTWRDVVLRPVWLKVPLEALAVGAAVALGIWWLRPPPAPPEPERAQVAMKVRMLEEMRQEQLPADQPAPVVMAERADKDSMFFAAEVAAPAPAALGLEGKKAWPAPVVVTGDSLVAVRMRVEKLARDLNGRVELETPTNALMVFVPAGQVNEFRARVAQPLDGRRRAARPAVAWSAPAAPVREKSAAVEPLVAVPVVVEVAPEN